MGIQYASDEDLNEKVLRWYNEDAEKKMTLPKIGQRIITANEVRRHLRLIYEHDGKLLKVCLNNFCQIVGRFLV